MNLKQLFAVFVSTWASIRIDFSMKDFDKEIEQETKYNKLISKKYWN